MRKIITADVFDMARIIKKINIKNEIPALIEATRKRKELSKEELAERVGIDLIMTVIYGCAEKDVESALYNLVASIMEKKPDEVKMQSIEATVADLMKICEENNIVNFFKAAGGLPTE